MTTVKAYVPLWLSFSPTRPKIGGYYIVVSYMYNASNVCAHEYTGQSQSFVKGHWVAPACMMRTHLFTARIVVRSPRGIVFRRFIPRFVNTLFRSGSTTIKTDTWLPTLDFWLFVWFRIYMMMLMIYIYLYFFYFQPANC